MGSRQKGIKRVRPMLSVAAALIVVVPLALSGCSKEAVLWPEPVEGVMLQQGQIGVGGSVSSMEWADVKLTDVVCHNHTVTHSEDSLSFSIDVENKTMEFQSYSLTGEISILIEDKGTLIRIDAMLSTMIPNPTEGVEFHLGFRDVVFRCGDNTSEDSVSNPIERELNVVYFDESGGWRGGMYGGIARKNEHSVDVWGWVPGMSAAAHCSLNPWMENETPLGTSYVGTSYAFDLVATLESEPVILYTATSESSGLTPQETRLYFQRLDLNACNLGTRYDVIGVPLPDSLESRITSKFIGVTNDTVAIQTISKAENGIPVLMGIKPSGERSWVEESSEEDEVIVVRGRQDGVSFFTQFSNISINQVFVVSWYWEVDYGTARVVLVVSASDGSVLAQYEKSDYGETWIADAQVVSEDSFLFHIVENMPYLNGSAKVGYGNKEGMNISSSGSFLVDMDSGWPHDYMITRLSMHDEEKGRVWVGLYCSETEEICESGISLGYIDKYNQFTQILSSDQMDQLDVHLEGVSNGKVFITTTNEQIIIDLKGQQVGASLPRSDDSGYPKEDKIIGGHLWTSWSTEEGSAVAMDGVIPKSSGWA